MGSLGDARPPETCFILNAAGEFWRLEFTGFGLRTDGVYFVWMVEGEPAMTNPRFERFAATPVNLMRAPYDRSGATLADAKKVGSLPSAPLRTVMINGVFASIVGSSIYLLAFESEQLVSRTFKQSLFKEEELVYAGDGFAWFQTEAFSASEASKIRRLSVP